MAALPHNNKILDDVHLAHKFQAYLVRCTHQIQLESEFLFKPIKSVEQLSRDQFGVERRYELSHTALVHVCPAVRAATPPGTP